MAARWSRLFGSVKGAVIGMIHVQALPGKGSETHNIIIMKIQSRLDQDTKIVRVVHMHVVGHSVKGHHSSEYFPVIAGADLEGMKWVAQGGPGDST